jgi:protein phosphatase
VQDGRRSDQEGHVSEQLEPWRIEVAGETHAGNVRASNEDAWATAEDVDLWMVADGIAGRPGGDAAARLAVDTVRTFFDDPDRTWPGDPEVQLAEGGTRLVEAVTLANRRIRERAAASPWLAGMGTTFAAVLALPRHLWIAHAGDSRVYRFREGQLELLTADHCAGSDPRAEEWFDRERLATAPPDALTRALGLRERVAVDVRLEEIRSRDVVLLATDGLTKMVDDATSAKVLAERRDVRVAVRALIAYALDRGGHDNVTCVVARWAS